MRALLFSLLVFSLSGCTSQSLTAASPEHTTLSDTMEMRRIAARQYPESSSGTFTLNVVATGSQRDAVFLNTEADYRDPRNITIALPGSLVREFTERHNERPEAYFKGKTLNVSGELKQVEILFLKDGRPSGKYYYQTHVRPGSLDDIRIVSAE